MPARTAREEALERTSGMLQKQFSDRGLGMARAGSLQACAGDTSQASGADSWRSCSKASYRSSLPHYLRRQRDGLDLRIYGSRYEKDGT